MCGFEKDQLSWRLWTVSRLVTFHHGNNNVPALLLESVSRPQGTETLTYCVAYCVTTHSSNVIVNFVDDTTVVGLITDDNESAYREEVHSLKNWCHNSNLSLNISKTKELVVDFRRRTSEHPPHHHRQDSSGAGQQLQVPRRKHHRGTHLDYSHTVSSGEGPPASLIPQATEEIWSEFKNPQKVLQLHCGEHPDCTASPPGTELHRSQPESPEETAQHIVGGELPSLQEIYPQRCVRKARKIIRDSCHLSHELFSLLPSGRRYRSIRTQTSRTRDSFFSQAIRLLNSR